MQQSTSRTPIFKYPYGKGTHPGAAHQRQKVQIKTHTDHPVLRHVAGCQRLVGDTDTGEARFPQDLPFPFSTGGQACLEAVPSPLGPHGSNGAGGAPGSSAYAPSAEVSLHMGAMPTKAPTRHGEGHQEAAHGPRVVGNPRGSRLDPVLRRQVVSTDASLAGWGKIHEGKGTSRKWSGV